MAETPFFEKVQVRSLGCVNRTGQLQGLLLASSGHASFNLFGTRGHSGVAYHVDHQGRATQTLYCPSGADIVSMGVAAGLGAGLSLKRLDGRHGLLAEVDELGSATLEIWNDQAQVIWEAT